VVGEKRAPLALLGSGFVLGIPVFFETVFLLMIPLGKALHFVTGRNYLLYVLSIIAGATMTHSLVPPTPGPLFVAVALKVNMGLMILCGCIVGIITAGTGWAYAHWLDRRSNISIRERGEPSLNTLAKASPKPETKLPPLWLALLPVLLPLVLITAASFLEAPGANSRTWLHTLGEPSIALGISAFIGMLTLLWQGKSRREVFSASVGRSMEEAGTIILIISAGGAFGGVLQQAGIGPRVLELSMAYHLPMLPLAWTLTALLRIAQGSATVAMITTVGVVGAMATPEALGFHPVWLAVAIGCGSKPIPWMNDGGFWVVAKMSGLTEKECLTTYSPMVFLMGVVGLIVVMILANLFPMI
jgi:gluconate:H+ symporter, GntP family